MPKYTVTIALCLIIWSGGAEAQRSSVEVECREATRNAAALLSAAGSVITQDAIDKAIAHCQRADFPAAARTCAKTATSADGYLDKCLKAVFIGDTELRIKREIDAGRDNSKLKPPVGADGDFLMWNKTDRCGYLTRIRFEVTSIYLLCGGKLLAGPLTTEKEVSLLNAELQAMQRAKFEAQARASAYAYELGRRVRQHWPNGGATRVRVYDQNGAWLRDE